VVGLLARGRKLRGRVSKSRAERRLACLLLVRAMNLATIWLLILALMGFWCDFHRLTFGTRSAWSNHRRLHHNLPDTPSDNTRVQNFAHLDGMSLE
jgi:hypothetical protein